MTRLGALLRLYRTVHHRSLEAVAGEMGITRRRLHGLEHGRGGSLRTFAKVLLWLLAPDEALPLLEPTDTITTRRPSPVEGPTDAPRAADSLADAIAERSSEQAIGVELQNDAPPVDSARD
jgi:transcriptional regulator with XRE-family HTH domain